MLKAILEDLQSGPTLLRLSKVIHVLQILHSIDTHQLVQQDEDFLNIMDLLANAYSDSAIFEVHHQHQIFLEEISIWLTQLGQQHTFGQNKDDLTAYAQLFLQTMSDES